MLIKETEISFYKDIGVNISMGQLSTENIKILKELQNDARITNSDLAEKVNMSQSPCWRHVKKMEQEGIISGYTAKLDRRKLGLGVLVYVSIEIDTHNEEMSLAFEHQIGAISEIISCHSVAGGADFMLQVVCRDLDAYTDFSMNTLRRLPGIKSMTTNFALKEIKAYNGFPLDI